MEIYSWGSFARAKHRCVLVVDVTMTQSRVVCSLPIVILTDFFFPQIGCYGRSTRSKFKFLRPFQTSDLRLTCGGLNRCKPHKEMVGYSVDYGSVMINKKERKR